MSEVLELISELRDRGVNLWAQGNELRYKTAAGSLTATDVARLRACKPQIMQLLAEMTAYGGSPPPTIQKVDRAGPIALSFAQQRLWFLLQMEGASEAYHLASSFRLRGTLNEPALRRALDRVVQRHECLRTRIEIVGSESLQRIDPPGAGFRLQFHDLTAAIDAESQVKALIAEEACAPFDLQRETPVRGRLIRVTPEQHVLLITLHHIAADGWSFGILARELSALYNSFARSKSDPLPPLPVQYADFAAWQRQWLSGDRLKLLSDYWRSALAGCPALLELPLDHPRPAVQDFEGTKATVTIDRELTSRLKHVSRRVGTTLFMTVLAAWAIVLSRFSGQRDIVIGAPAANRAHTDIEGLIGLFLNAVPLRMDLSEDLTVRELLLRSRDVVLAAQEHEDLPFEEIVKLANPARAVAYTPLFQVMFAWQNNDEATFDFAGLEADGIRPATRSAKYDLTLDLGEVDGRIVGALSYATALFDAATIERHLSCLQQILDEMTVDVQRPVDALEILSPQERHRVLVEWNRTSAPYPASSCIHELLEDQARQTPDHIAIVDGDHRVTFGELNGQANRLARFLLQAGVSADQTVGVCAERSYEMVVAMLAVLKAGGAYVPMDPAYPAERLRYMLDDAAPRVLLTQRHLRNAMDYCKGVVAILDDVWSQVEQNDDTDLPASAVGVTPDNLAYVIYTSGSTGRPKGTMNEHRGMVNRICAQRNIETFTRHDICCQKTSISFVDAVFEIFGALCNGCPLVIVPGDAARDGRQMASLIARERVTRLITVPSFARSLLGDAEIVRDLRSLRSWTLSGEAVQPDLMRNLHDRLPDCEVIIQYGSSEVSSDAAIFKARRFTGQRVPLGRPLQNVRIFILDRLGRPVPAGVCGEIHVAGVGVGRGYIGRPDLTASRFFRDPFGSLGSGRLYKTGDLGRWRADGVLEYLGRNDHQVKLRGFRIELGEIDAQLLQQDEVREAVVILREDIPGNPRLVAYIALESATVPASAMVESLRSRLKSALPDYMVPSAIVTLESLPRTPNGKLDRCALPMPGDDAYQPRQYQEAEGGIEKAIEEIWRGLLHVERAGRHDNFFELGGHSLHGVPLVAGIAEQFGVRLPVAAMFQYPTIAQLANVVEAFRLRPSGGASLQEVALGLPVQAVSGSSVPSRVPLSFSQLAFWNMASLGSRPSMRNVVCARRLRGHLNVDLLRASVDRVARRHDAFHTRIVLVDGLPMQEIADTALPTLDVRDVTEAQHVIDAMLAPIDVTTDALCAISLLQLEESNYVFVVAMEHMISDVYSAKRFVEEAFEVYTSLDNERPISLPEVGLQFTEYSLRQRQAVAPWRQASGAYWNEKLKDARRVRFPADALADSTSSGWGAVPLLLGQDLRAKLQHWCRQHRSTLVMGVFAAYSALVLRWCEVSDAVILYQTDGRSTPQLANTIGYVASALLLRVEVRPRDNFLDLLDRVAREYGTATEHGDSAYIAAQTPTPEFVRNTSFNWAPQDFNLEPSMLGGSHGSLTHEPYSVPLASLKAVERDTEPSVQFFDRRVEVAGRLNFPLNRFSTEGMERFARNLVYVVEELVSHPTRRLTDLVLMP